MLGLMTMSNKHVINIQQEVNPAFKSVWTTNKPYNILKGGRNSFKSSVIALKLAYMMIQYIRKGKKANVVVIRKVRSEEHTSELQSRGHLVCRLLLEKKNIAHCSLDLPM